MNTCCDGGSLLSGPSRLFSQYVLGLALSTRAALQMTLGFLAPGLQPPALAPWEAFFFLCLQLMVYRAHGHIPFPGHLLTQHQSKFKIRWDRTATYARGHCLPATTDGS